MSPGTPGPTEVPRVLDELARWQRDGLPLQLHPGDVGWATRLGPAVAAATLRTWRVADELAVVAMLDGPQVLRLAVDPHRADDPGLARAVAADLDDPARGVLAPGAADVEARAHPALAAELRSRGWADGDAWTSLTLDLADPAAAAPPGDVAVEIVDDASVGEWTTVLASAFGTTRPAADDLERWRCLSVGAAAHRLRAVLLRDDSAVAVAAAAVWSAGPGRPGLLEPLGVHAAHRGRGLGRTATLAAAAVLRDLGCSTATVATPSANVAAVAAYRSAGMRDLGEVSDLRRA